MKKSTFSPAKIAGVLKEFAGGRNAEELARKMASAQPLCISGARNTMGGMPVSLSG